MLSRLRWAVPVIVLASSFGWAQASHAPVVAKVATSPRTSTTTAASAPAPTAPVNRPIVTTHKPVPVQLTYLPVGLTAATPIENQGSYLGGYACAPTAVSMVFGYFHNLNSAYQAATPQQLADSSMLLAGQGIPYPAMISRMQALGYSTLLGHEHATLTELKSNLTTGPVIVSLGVSSNATTLAPGSVNHSVVVVGVASDNSSVLVNDPRLGRQVAVPMGTFQTMWAAGANTVIILRP